MGKNWKILQFFFAYGTLLIATPAQYSTQISALHHMCFFSPTLHTCIHHRIQLAVGDMTMSGWKPTISLIPPPYTRTHTHTFCSQQENLPRRSCEGWAEEGNIEAMRENQKSTLCDVKYYANILTETDFKKKTLSSSRTFVVGGQLGKAFLYAWNINAWGRLQVEEELAIPHPNQTLPAMTVSNDDKQLHLITWTQSAKSKFLLFQEPCMLVTSRSLCVIPERFNWYNK